VASAEGNILKLKSTLGDPIEYSLPIGDQEIPLNPLIGKKISFEYRGVINCIATGEKIKKSYNQGYSYESFIKLAACDLCIVKPELCHYEKGTCREPEWGEKNCMQPHIIYLANSSNVKVGITRESQVPTRWIDQGASQALPILRVPTRHLSGLLEVEIKNYVSDKTNWRKMLKGESEPEDLETIRDEIFEGLGSYIDELEAEDLEEEIVNLSFPVTKYPEKVKSKSFDKSPVIEGKLLGIKGQYLLFDGDRVLNMRKHQGYYLKLSY